jgi:FAD/FMN-containing dehydrogenase|eukprot:COSAG01_NODE_2752_length_7143_cov_35.819989_8_plen_417_part_00
MVLLPLLLLLLLAYARAVAPPGSCRCVPPHPCWDRIPWHELNRSVSGRLRKSVDELAPCIPSKGGDVQSAACAQALDKTDDEFWLADRPNGYQHTGLFNVWNITNDLSEYSVLAQTLEDFSATVKFAHDHNLRLVVKATGHDWYGRSTAAGSLLLWTHLRKGITWHDSFVAEGCAPSSALPAATVESGVQFMDLYPEAHEHGKIMMGGTCDSVGVAGCWMAGCYGPFTRKFGSGAINILQARVVLANGTAVTASKCSHPDLFASIRGGGGGVAGVVTDFVARSHREPRYTSNAGFSGSASTKPECLKLVARVLRGAAALQMNHSAGELCDNNGLHCASACRGIRASRTPDSCAAAAARARAPPVAVHATVRSGAHTAELPITLAAAAYGRGMQGLAPSQVGASLSAATPTRAIPRR